jgi:hypothetical protein
VGMTPFFKIESKKVKNVSLSKVRTMWTSKLRKHKRYIAGE